MRKSLLIAICFYSTMVSSQVGIGTTTPADACALDIVSTDSGILIPRIALTGTSDTSTIVGTEVEALLVYNTAAVSNVTPGFYYWDGSQWIKLPQDAWLTHGNSNITEPGLENISSYGVATLGLNDGYFGTNNQTDVVISTNQTERLRISGKDIVGTAGTGYGEPLIGLFNNVTYGNVAIGVPAAPFRLTVGGSSDRDNIIMVGRPNRENNNGLPVSPVPGDVMSKNSIFFPGYRNWWGTTKVGAYITSENIARDTSNGYSYTGESQHTHLVFGTVERAINSFTEPQFPTERMRITHEGNVGINIAAPTEKLHVNGNILATGTITPDYVFQKYFTNSSQLNPEYKMYSLNEIEEYVKQHYHLPGVPSASEVKEKGGIVINRATEINLEKIEELFLHLIVLQDKLEKANETITLHQKQLSYYQDEMKRLKKAINFIEQNK